MVMKKITSLFTAFAAVFCIAVYFPADVHAENVTDKNGFVTQKWPGGVFIEDYKGKGGDIVIPDGVDGIDGGVFMFNDSITSVTVPKNSSLKMMGTDAFRGCINLKTLTIENDMEFISESAFENCVGLEKVTIKGSLTDTEYGSGGIMANTFRGCLSLKEVNFTNKKAVVDQIGTMAFYGCVSLEKVILPDGLDVIRPLAFANCVELTKMTIPKKTKLPEYEGVGGNVGFTVGYETASESAKALIREKTKYETITPEVVKADGKTPLYFQFSVTKKSQAQTLDDPRFYKQLHIYDGKVLCGVCRYTQKKMTLTVTKNSPAEKWAKKNGIKYVCK